MKTIKLKIRNTALAIFIITSFNATAQDVIAFTWQAGTSSKGVSVRATQGKTFTIDWGDGNIVEETGYGNETMFLSHAYSAENTYNVKLTTNTTDCRFTYLSCYNKQIKSLDISNDTELTDLVCGNNQLTNLDVSNNTKLENLGCSDNQITSLNLSNNTELIEIWSYNNPLTNIDISNNQKLKRINSANNLFTSLNITNNELLEHLECSNNQLTSLNVNNNRHLNGLGCSNNQLSELDLTANMWLSYLKCENNQLSLSDLYLASQKVNNQEDKHLGTQTLQPLTVLPNTELFAEQSEFGGIFTNYTVIKNGSSAPASDYTVTDGKITFHTLGTYTVTMTNAAIISHTNYPAKVVVEITVSDISITNSQFGTMNCVVYPNPTKSMVFVEYDFRKNFEPGYELLFEAIGKKADKDCGKGTVRVYNLSGILLNSSTLNEVRGLEVINIETYPTGTYLIEVSDCYGNTNSVKVIKN